MSEEPSVEDVLMGVLAIAKALGWTTRQVHHMKDEHGLPTFKIGKTVCARRGAIRDWLAEREAAARKQRVGE